MRIIHIKGTQCSGKSHVCKNFIDNKDIAYWDILEFYENRKCIVNKKMDWDKWEKYKKTIKPTLLRFIKAKEKENKKLCIIESATNQYVQSVMSEIPNTIEIPLVTPDIKTIKERASKRNLIEQEVLNFRDSYIRKHAGSYMTEYTQQEANIIIKAKSEGIKLGIIGTAGRKEDKPKMSRELYVQMYIRAIELINKYKLNPEDITAVSGGAAWADHIAVSLFLGNRVHNLHLHLPGEFDTDKPHYYGTESAKTANYYHSLFSQKMGGNTLDGIKKAIARDAKVKTYTDFRNRNLEVAKCDMLIAFTWGEEFMFPKPGGTSHTWDNSNATVKIHEPLSQL